VLTPPSKSIVRTNDGIFEASEIAALRVNADLVVLSACNTAGAAGRFGGDALSGLAESFFFAGARSLLVSHWQVPSSATATLMSQLFKALGPDLSLGASNSLQSAQRRMISEEKSAHPFFWGAFVLVGDGAADQMLPISRGAKSVADQRVNTRSAS
jgi:CHAT domain-containing protein